HGHALTRVTRGARERDAISAFDNVEGVRFDVERREQARIHRQCHLRARVRRKLGLRERTEPLRRLPAASNGRNEYERYVFARASSTIFDAKSDAQLRAFELCGQRVT